MAMSRPTIARLVNSLTSGFPDCSRSSIMSVNGDVASLWFNNFDTSSKLCVRRCCRFNGDIGTGVLEFCTVARFAFSRELRYYTGRLVLVLSYSIVPIVRSMAAFFNDSYTVYCVHGMQSRLSL